MIRITQRRKAAYEYEYLVDRHGVASRWEGRAKLMREAAEAVEKFDKEIIEEY